ncbi:MAG: hypothetical protein HQL32_12800 [Planctomycetes bacterium]|nr:hypothetical protein [Planctomycetota bacterium]
MKLLFPAYTNWPWLLVGFLFLSILTLYIYSRLPLRQPWRILLPLMRILAYLLLIICFLQPLLVTQRTINHEGYLPIIIDNSGSMSVIDDYNDDDLLRIASSLDLLPEGLESQDAEELVAQWTKSSNTLEKNKSSISNKHRSEVREILKELKKKSRLELTKMILTPDDKSMEARLAELGKVEFFDLKDDFQKLDRQQINELEANVSKSRLGSRISQIIKAYENQAASGLIIFSDGNNNSGRSLAEVAKQAQDRDLPIYAMSVGLEKEVKDIIIEEVYSPRSIFKGDFINLSLKLRRFGFEHRTLKLKLWHEQKVVLTKDIIAGQGTQHLTYFGIKALKAGINHFRVEIENLEGEALKENNFREFNVKVLQDRIKTLLVDEFPRWETRYANMMLKRDPRIDLHTVFIGSSKKGKLAVGQGAYPESQEALNAYHILVLGDINPRHFSQIQLESIRSFVVDRGGTLILMAGPHHMPSSFEGGALSDLLPFHYSAANKEGVNKYHLSLKEENRHDDLIQLGNSEESNLKLWQELPSLSWVSSTVHPTKATDTLVSAGDSKAALMSRYTSGRGRVLYLGSDSFWRWRYKAGWEYHHRFWSQILHWATQTRTSGSERLIKLMTDRTLYSPGESIIIHSRIFSQDELPLEDATAYVELYNEKEEQLQKLQLTFLDKSGGQYQAKIHGLKAGDYSLKAKVMELQTLGIEGRCKFHVKDTPTSEYVDLTLNRAHLEVIGDQVLPFYQIQEVLKQMKPAQKSEVLRSEISLWNNVYFMIFFALLLGMEWHFRKKNELV